MFDPEPHVAVAGDRADTRLSWVLEQQPSAATLGVLESLLDTAMSPDERVKFAVACDRQLSTMTALAMAADVAATTAGTTPFVNEEPSQAELALALRRSDQSMSTELRRARRLVMLPVTFALQQAGAATVRHAIAMADLTAPLSDDDALAVDAEVGARAATMTVSGFRRVVRKAVAKLDSRSPRAKREAARRQVGVKAWPAPDGLMTIAATMPAVDGVAVITELNRRADAIRTEDDERTHGERQVDALLAALAGAVPPASPTADAKRRPARRTEIQVVIDWRSLLGLRDTPAELLGYGSIPAEQVRAMLAEPGTVLRRLVADPVDGVLIDYGTTRYRPDAHLAGLTKARDVTCRYPGCTRNAAYCDDEHCTPYPDGPTSAGNVSQLCRKHHRRKTFDGFTYERPDPANGRTVWTTPLGFRYVQESAWYDDVGPDPGDVYSLAMEEPLQRWVPGQPPGPDPAHPPDPPAPTPYPDDPPF